MSTTIKRRDGGYFTMPNRWVDAGYMKAAPGSVTQVYLFLSRWADNTTLSTAQPMRLIAGQCGLSEDIARRAVRTLEAWGVLTREPGSGRSAANVWHLNDLASKAPEYPDKVPPKQSGGPQQTAPPQTTTPYQPNEINDAKASSPTEKSANKKPRELQPDEEIVDVWATECNGGAWPVNVGIARRHAKALVKAGFTPDETRALIEWLRRQAWIKGGIDLNLMISQADKFRSANRGGTSVRRQADKNGGLVLG